jgi:hypothetical protein
LRRSRSFGIVNSRGLSATRLDVAVPTRQTLRATLRFYGREVSHLALRRPAMLALGLFVAAMSAQSGGV